MKTEKKKIAEVIFSLAVMLVISIGGAMIMKKEQTGSAFVPETILAASVIFTMGIIVVLLGIKMFKYLETKSRQQIQKQIIPFLILFYALTLLIAYLTVTFGFFIWYLIKGYDLHQFISHLFLFELKGVKASPLLLATLVLLYLLWRKSITREQQLEQEKVKFQYKTLKNQVNPHFLFNSLNTLSSLISSDPKAADEFVNKLSDIYRYIIDNEEKSLVSLEEELHFVKNYFDLQKIRDNDKIFLNIEISDLQDYTIIPVSLQTLIENALKHNSATKGNPLIVTIIMEDQYIEVKNNIQLKSKLEASSGKGLQNLKERVKLATAKEVIVEQDQQTFIVKIPVMKDRK